MADLSPEAKLEKLKGLVDMLYKSEKTRLLQERAFLQDVFDKSYKGASAVTHDKQVAKVIADLAAILPPA